MQIEIPDALAAAVAEIAVKTGQDVQSLVAEMVSEAIKMRRVPGIVFANGPTGRCARVGGTGIEVFEVIQAYELFGRDRERVQQDLPQLDRYQLDAAIAYYDAYPEDVRPHLHTEDEDRAALEALRREIPQTSIDWPGRLPEAQRPTAVRSAESA